jgi:hypothetical protein
VTKISISLEDDLYRRVKTRLGPMACLDGSRRGGYPFAYGRSGSVADEIADSTGGPFLLT